MAQSQYPDLDNYWRDDSKMYYVTMSLEYLNCCRGNLEEFFDKFSLFWKEGK